MRVGEGGREQCTEKDDDCGLILLMCSQRQRNKKNMGRKIIFPPFPTSDIAQSENIKDVEHGVRVCRTINNCGSSSSGNGKLRQRWKGGQLFSHTRERRIDYALRVKAGMGAHRPGCLG